LGLPLAAMAVAAPPPLAAVTPAVVALTPPQPSLPSRSRRRSPRPWPQRPTRAPPRPQDALPFTVLLLSVWQLVAQGGASSVAPCAADGENCEASGCCRDPDKRCFRKDGHLAFCRASCTPGNQSGRSLLSSHRIASGSRSTPQSQDPADEQIDEQTPWNCTEVPRSEIAWNSGLQGTTFWDCNGAGCDAVLIKPTFVQKLFIYAAPYAPSNPRATSMYGERLWLTGAASDTLAEMMGPDAACCGSDKDSSACGRCLLVRNPTAVNSNWTAVIMKKSRCPPESKGCEAGKVHMDIAVPGYENIEFSTANVCGSRSREDTFISKREAGTCADWKTLGVSSMDQGCTCHGIPNTTVEQARLREGCEVFTQWGWTSGAPQLEYVPVDCPKEFVEIVEEAFGGKGPKSMEHVSYTMWIIAGIGIAIACGSICIVNRIIDHREEKKRYANMQNIKRRRSEQAARTTTASSSDTTSETGSSSESE